jgi:ATPase subunit of ABC transporter with duplicated ATPase domains
LRVGALSQADTLEPGRSVGYTLVGEAAEHQWAGDARVRDVVAGLVSDIAWGATVATLSGGQRRRVQLARLLVGEWDVIALDEPTNHLDIEGITWLAGHLRQRWARNTGGLLLVTHDRWFLDEVATTTWEVHDGIVEPFDGGYAAYVLQRVERDRMAARAEAKRQNLMRKELAWLRRGAPARTSKPKFRIEAANQLIADVPPLRNTVELAKLATARLGKDVVDLLDVSVSFGGRPVLRDIEWRIAPGERTGIVGANGAGKSTTLRMLTGLTRPDAGSATIGGKAFTDLANPARTVGVMLDTSALHVGRTGRATLRVAAMMAGVPAGRADELLEATGLAGAASRRVGTYSLGMRQRLGLALALLGSPAVLILDEPANGLDPEGIAWIRGLLRDHAARGGTVLLSSHLLAEIQATADQLVIISAGRIVAQGPLQQLLGGTGQNLEEMFLSLTSGGVR